MRNIVANIFGIWIASRHFSAKRYPSGENLPDEAKKLQLDFLNSEYKYVNDRLAGYSEADQKIIAVAATIIVGALGFAITKYSPETAGIFPYVFFLSAGFISLAVIQSVLYSALALYSLQRKVELTLSIENLLGIPRKETTIAHFAFNLKYQCSYIAAVVPYWAFKSLAGAILFSFSLKYDAGKDNDIMYWTAYYVSLGAAAVSFVVVWVNAVEQIVFSIKRLKKFAR